MAIITSEILKDIAVQCTEQFLNEKIPLSVGLAKAASEYNLNSDQIHRCVEATNTVAFLKVKSISDDKTCEFPLAKYAEVIANATVPEIVPEFEGFEGVEKVASFTEITDQSEVILSGIESRIYFDKMAAANERRVKDLEIEGEIVKHQMMKLAREIEQDPRGLDKMAQVMGDEYAPLSVLVTGSVQKKLDTGGTAIFPDYQTKQAQELSHLYKSAQAIVAEIRQRKPDLEKSAAFYQSLKNTVQGAVGGVKTTFRQPTGSIEKGVAGLTKAIVKPIANVAATPVKAVTGMARAARNSAAKSGVGSALGIKPSPNKVGLTAKGVMAGAGVAASVGVDALMYSPGVDKTTGEARDVWKALG